MTTTDFVKPTLSSLLSEVFKKLINFFVIVQLSLIAHRFYKAMQVKSKRLIVQVGGSMGLWLGLSVVQGVQLLGNLVTLFRNCFGKTLRDGGLCLFADIPL